MHRDMENSGELGDAVQVKALHCRVCARPFKQSGHLRRHERTHSTARPFACSQCPRTFARRDALQRHADSHLDGPSLLQQGSRACTACALAKTRCSGELRCKRCGNRGLECLYPWQDSNDSPSGLASHESTSTGETTSPVVQLPQQSVMPLQMPVQVPDSFISGVDDFAYDDWVGGFFHESNWLEASINSDMCLSPLSWILEPYPDAAAGFPTSSPSIIHSVEASSEDGPHIDLETNEQPGAEEGNLTGTYYVDGEPARLPRVRRRPETSTRSRHAQLLWSGTFSLHLPDTTTIPPTKESLQLSDENYTMILDSYNRFCRSNALFPLAFAESQLPRKEVLDALAGVFRERFSNVLPFIHWPTFSTAQRTYLYDLAIVSIGSNFIGNPSFCISLHEFTRRCLVAAWEDILTPPEVQYDLTAALLLNIVGLAYCGDESLRQTALQARPRLKACFEKLKREIEYAPIDVAEQTVADRWSAWAQRESRTRLAFSIWLVDTMLVAHYAAQPIFSLESVTFPLPCSDDMWNYSLADAWAELADCQSTPATLMQTLQKLYYNKSFPSRQGEFVRILAIHGLFHRLWEVERYYSGTLSHWEPSSSRQSGTAPFSQTPPWLPAVPAFRSWQNVSCDALDVLHWQANSTIGQMRGLEHPTVLHLHFARIVLLCPCYDILALVRHLSTSNGSAGSRDEIDAATNMVRRWAVQHQFKARLAAIHAGVAFWHVRRHGIEAFYEAPSLALAALVLWAFSIFAERQPTTRSRMPSVPPETAVTTTVEAKKDLSNGEVTDIILLDRPTDDELVQQFIRDGSSMRPFMSGVGDVFALNAPPRILDKGIELLRHQGCWGASTEWTRLLQSLRASRRLDSRSQ